MTNSAEKVRLAGNQNVMVCERGTMFGYSKLVYLLKIHARLTLEFICKCFSKFYMPNVLYIVCHADDLIVDPRNFEWMREANCPVVSTITHLYHHLHHFICTRALKCNNIFIHVHTYFYNAGSRRHTCTTATCWEKGVRAYIYYIYDMFFSSF